MPSATLTLGRQSFTATEQSFRLQTEAGKVVEGPWTLVDSVMAMTVSAKVNGVDVGTWQHLGVTLASGESFQARTRDKAAFAVAQVALAAAAPSITKRVLERIDSGETVGFGEVSLRRDRLVVRGRAYPVSVLAGHRTAHGFWMFDVEPTLPRLAAAVSLDRLPNHFALRAALERLRPGFEYPQSGPDRGSLMRPSASSHDPRYLSGRARVLLLGGAVGAALLVGLGVLGGFELSRRAELQRIEAARAATQARLAQLLAAGRAASIPETPFACAALPKDADDAVMLVETPAGVEHPFQGLPYVYGYDGVHEVYPADASTHALLARVRSFTRQGGGPYELEASVALLDASTGQVACSGRVAASVAPSLGAATSLARGLAAALCKPGSRELACERLSTAVRVLPVAPLPSAAPVAAAPAAPAAPAWAKGQKVQAQRRNKWVPAVILQKAKGGWRVRYDGTRVEETVPESRMRAR